MTDNPNTPPKSPAIPQLLTQESKIRFRCYPGISCFNTCCKKSDITLAPYDVIRLQEHLGMGSAEFLKQYTVPFQMDQDGLPGVKMQTTDDGVCLLLDGENGCGVYADRPTVCRYYPIALLNKREQGSSQAEEDYSLVREDHCKGHEEDREMTIADYRQEQGCTEYDDVNREWYQLILKKKSAGPGIGQPSETSMQFFFMVCYNIDMFRRFVASENFKKTYIVDDAFYASIEHDNLALLRFGFRLLRQVLFSEKTIEEREGVWDERVTTRREVWDARMQA
ncbi:MAG: YkgJ family cysteine cluster protein, partial [Gammaproteobacteria bacterium]|nr:YkgJ family cysteine cluster protein [Gammaproteobacteria bacterium]